MSRRTARNIAVAALLLYIDLGAAIGFAIAHPAAAQSACWPRDSVFGLLETHCTTAVAGWSWFLAVGLPRTLIVFPSLAVAVIKAGFSNSGLSGGASAQWIPWIFYAVPPALAVWLVIARRGKRFLPLLSLLIAILVAEVIHLAWRA